MVCYLKYWFRILREHQYLLYSLCTAYHCSSIVKALVTNPDKLQLIMHYALLSPEKYLRDVFWLLNKKCFNMKIVRKCWKKSSQPCTCSWLVRQFICWTLKTQEQRNPIYKNPSPVRKAQLAAMVMTWPLGKGLGVEFSDAGDWVILHVT